MHEQAVSGQRSAVSFPISPASMRLTSGIAQRAADRSLVGADSIVHQTAELVRALEGLLRSLDSRS